MKYKEQKELVENLRSLADFYEKPESIVLPKPYFNTTHGINEGEWGTVDGEYKFTHNLLASQVKLKRFVRALGSCEKKWNDSQLRIVKYFGDTINKIRIEFYVERQVVCEKVVTGTKRQPKHAYVEIPNEYVEVEEVEWVCHDVSLLS